MGITRIGHVVSLDKSPYCHASYAPDTKLLTIPKIDVPVISPTNGIPTLLGVSTFSCILELSEEGDSLSIKECEETADFQSIPKSGCEINFGHLSVAEMSSSKTVAIMNIGNYDLTVSHVTITGTDSSDFTVSPTGPFTIHRDSLSSPQELEITCTPSIKGMHLATLSLVTNDGNHTYDMSCNGVVPTYDSNPKIGSNINFGSVLIDQSSEAEIISIVNKGNAELKVTDMTINGANANSFSVLSDESFTLSGEDSDEHQLEVACTPTIVGELTATLTVTSNDTDSPHRYELSCIGSSTPEPHFDSEPQVGNSISLGSDYF